MAIVDIPVSGPFSLDASIRFLEGFPPARYRGTAAEQVLRLAQEQRKARKEKA